MAPTPKPGLTWILSSNRVFANCGGCAIDLEFTRNQLGTLQRLDTRFRVFGSSSHRYRLVDPIDSQPLTRFESDFGVKLPSDYCQFMTLLSNGGTGPNYGLVEFSKASRGHSPADCFPSVGEPYQRQSGSFDYGNVPGTIWLSDNGCATFDVLVVNGPSHGFVWTIIDEEDYCCCRSFETWYLGWLASAINTIRRESILEGLRLGMRLDDIRSLFGHEIVPVAADKREGGYLLCFHDCNVHFFFDSHDRLTRFEHQSHIISPRIREIDELSDAPKSPTTRLTDGSSFPATG